MSFYDYARDWFIEHLERDIESHEGRGWDVGENFDDAPEWDLIEDETQSHRLGIAYNFRDMWMDARNHEWRYYPASQRKIGRSSRAKSCAVFAPPPAPPRVWWWQRFKR